MASFDRSTKAKAYAVFLVAAAGGFLTWIALKKEGPGKAALAPSAASVDLASLGPDPQRYRGAVKKLSPGQFKPELIRLIHLPEGESKEALLRIFLREWGARDHFRAFVALRAAPGSRLGDYGLVVLQGWISTDPWAAWDWTLATYRGRPLNLFGEETACFQLLLTTLLDQGQGREATLLASNTREGFAGGLIIRASSAWAGSDPAAAIRWLDSVTDSTVRENGLQGVLSGIACKAPDLAQSYATGLEDPVERQEAFVAVVDGMLKSSSDAAAFTWITGLRNGEEVDDAKRILIEDSLSYRQTEAEALSLIPTIVDEDKRRDTADEAAIRLRGLDPRAAADLVVHYESASEIARLLPEILKDWDGTDDAAAREYVRSVKGLSDDARRTILQGLGPQQGRTGL